VTPLSTTKDSYKALEEMERDVGTPQDLVADLAPELSGHKTKWMETASKYGVHMRWSEKGRKNQNHAAEGEINHLKQRWKRCMTEKNVPARLWDRSLVHEAQIMSLLARGGNNRSGYEQVTGRTPDISEYLDFGFYDLVWYHPGGGQSKTLLMNQGDLEGGLVYPTELDQTCAIGY
jgi:hypothetical protein